MNEIKLDSPNYRAPLLVRSAMIIIMSITAAMISACSCQDKEANPEPPIADRPAPGPLSGDTIFYAPVRTVTLSGAPLPGMIPIATLKPNAFDEPIATGVPTDTEGRSSIRLTLTEKVAIRAWDKSLHYFPNNFYDVLPGSGISNEDLVVSMVESAAIEAVLMLPSGLPASGDNAGLMMFHPVHGPWWPAEADANSKGEILFNHVPAGSFILRIKAASGNMVETPETMLAPGKSTHLGILYLQ